jgi:hypothetical protein
MIVAVSVVVFTHVSSYACDMFKACQDVRYCAFDNATPDNIWRQDLQNLLNAGAWTNVLDDTDACQNKLGASHGDDWARNKNGCDAQTLGTLAKNANCVAVAPPPSPPPERVFYCRSNGQTIPLGNSLPGFGPCEGPPVVGAACHCGKALGQVQ